MLAVNYRNLLTLMYPEITKIFNLETAAYFNSATVANVSISTFYYPKSIDFTSSNYLVGIATDALDDIPSEVIRGFKVTSPTRTLQDLFKYEEFVDPQVTFDYVPWFAVTQNLDPRDYVEKQYHKEIEGYLRQGWSHGHW